MATSKVFFLKRWVRWLAALVICAAAPLSQAADYYYELRYDLKLDPRKELAEVRIELGEGARHVRWMRFAIAPERHRGFEGDGDLEIDGEHVTWTPPDDGGALSYKVPVDHERDGRFDARLTDEWAIFRGDDLFPPARLRQRKGAEANATLHVKVPRGWSFVAPYRETDDNVFRIENPGRSLDRPTGWMAAGRIGVRRERIDQIRVAVAGPYDQGVRRMDILAFLNWNLPWVTALVPDVPGRLLVVSAEEEMWRGGLSGPKSLYLHADRPLVSENGTSTLMHEIIHSVTGLENGPGADWIVEGLAEFYSLELMRRSGTITERRFDRAMIDLREWGEDVEELDVANSTGPVTARAVQVMQALHQEIGERTEGEANLDDVFRALVESERKVTLKSLRAAAKEVIGESAESLEDDRLPGI